MKDIFLVFTVHKDFGHANSSVLLGFLEQYQPEVIYVELPRYAFDSHYGLFYTKSDLESTAVRQYRNNRQYNDKTPVEVVPVDLPVPEYSERDYIKMFERIANESHHHHRLMDENSRDIRDDGFFYLNGERSSQCWAEIYAEWTATVKTINDPELTERFSLWRDMHERRDFAMMNAIYQHCRDHNFERGVFLVGAAHRKSIIDKAAGLAGEDPEIRWSWQE